jgi:archaemetzincin
MAIAAALGSALGGIPAMSFEPPTPEQRLEAIGSTRGLSDTLRRAFDPGKSFEPIPKPNRQDWLAVHSEPGQTFDEFVRSGANRPDKTRNKIYLQPLGEFAKDCSPSTEMLREYAAAYFSMPVQVLAPLDLAGRKLTTRTNQYTGKRQLLTGDVLDMLKRGLPADAFCLLAITMEDLYPEPSWNFVFGQASLRDRVGVYSFARYDPAFHGEPRGPDYQKVLLRRSGKVLVHETAHMFGLLHCIHFRCVVNGSNHLDESDSRPMHLCPVCLRKLQHGVGFDVVRRYEGLLRFYQKAGLDDEARWTGDRLRWIRGQPATQQVRP